MNLDLLQRLTRAIGLPGDEGAVRDILIQELTSYASSLTVTPLGNLIVEKLGEKRPPHKVMMAAHMDEVGLLVCEVLDSGALSVLTAGAIDHAVLLGKPVLVNGTIPGVIGGKPVHLMSGDEKEKTVPTEKLTVDIGAENREEAGKLASVGDLVSFVPFFENSRGTIKAKALDDRVGCFLLAELIKTPLVYDTTFVFTVQEEVGCRGAQTAANCVLPDIAIAVEGTVAGDVMGNKGAKTVTKMGSGPAISIIDKGTVYDRDLFKRAFHVARTLGIPCQARTGAAGANDASVMHKAGAGARALALSVPCRYIHCPVGMAALSDVENSFRLLQALLSRIHD